jgi:hypothetical protein
MANYALIDETGIVQCVTVWDGISKWQPPNNWTAVLNPENICAAVGWTYVNGTFTPPQERETIEQ